MGSQNLLQPNFQTSGYTTQIGATEAGNNRIGYVVHHAPGPMLAVQPTVELAKGFSQQR